MEESLESKKLLDVARFIADNITKVEEDIEPEEHELDPLICTATFPTYRINKRDFVLLHDIQYLFDLREDYCYAILAKWSENDRDFVES